jgi:hypothetical protein
VLHHIDFLVVGRFVYCADISGYSGRVGEHGTFRSGNVEK